MKFVFFLCSILVGGALQATTRIVSNVPGFAGAYTSLQDCITASSNGDIILVQGSGTNYGPLVLDKQLVIMGPGYLLNQNPETQAIPVSAKVEYINCIAGSTGSIIQGLEVTGYFAITSDAMPDPWSTSIGIATINVENAAVTFVSVKTDPAGQWIHLKNSNGSGFYKCYASGVFCSNNVAGLVLSNCLFSNGCYIRNTTVRHCLLDLNLDNNERMVLLDCNITNSILPSGAAGFYQVSSVFNKNIFLFGNPLGLNAGNNITDEAPQNLFVGAPVQGTFSDDGKFRLRTGCIAVGTGVDNVDIGPYGGADPYSPSGISFHPNIWSVTMPTTGTSGGGLQVQVKINANN